MSAETCLGCVWSFPDRSPQKDRRFPCRLSTCTTGAENSKRIVTQSQSEPHPVNAARITCSWSPIAAGSPRSSAFSLRRLFPSAQLCPLWDELQEPGRAALCSTQGRSLEPCWRAADDVRRSLYSVHMAAGCTARNVAFDCLSFSNYIHVVVGTTWRVHGEEARMCCTLDAHKRMKLRFVWAVKRARNAQHEALQHQCSDLTPVFIGMHRNAPLSPMKEGARVHYSYGSYAPSTYGSYEPRRANPSTVQNPIGGGGR